MKEKIYALLAGFGLIVSIAGCGNNNNANTAGSCQAGQVYTQQYGCLSQGACPAGQAQYNNQCVQTSYTTASNTQCAAGQVYTQYGCLAQGQCPVNQAQYGNSCVPATYNNAVNSCPAGQVYTQYGCLAQGYCAANQGQYGNQCLPAINTTTGYNGYPNGYPTGYSNNQCGAGIVYTQYGCLPQSNCPANYGFMNNQCYPAYNAYGTGFSGGVYWGVGIGVNSCRYYYNGMCVH